jgi:transcriptional regulator with XRE-family HTH domain
MKEGIYSKEQKKVVASIIGLRRDKKLTQQQVANHLGRTQSYISKLEAGQVRIDIPTLRGLARFYGTSVEQILRLSDLD